MLAAMTLADPAAMGLTRLAARTTRAAERRLRLSSSGARRWLDRPAAAAGAAAGDGGHRRRPGRRRPGAAARHLRGHGRDDRRWPTAIAWPTATAVAPPHYTVLGSALAEGRPEVLDALESTATGDLRLPSATARASPTPTPALRPPRRPTPPTPMSHRAPASADTCGRGPAGTSLQVRDPRRVGRTRAPVHRRWPRRHRLDDGQTPGRRQTGHRRHVTAPPSRRWSWIKGGIRWHPRSSASRSPTTARVAEVSRGDTATSALRGALAAPAIMPVRLDDDTTGRYGHHPARPGEAGVDDSRAQVSGRRRADFARGTRRAASSSRGGAS